MILSVRQKTKTPIFESGQFGGHFVLNKNNFFWKTNCFSPISKNFFKKMFGGKFENIFFRKTIFQKNKVLVYLGQKDIKKMHFSIPKCPLKCPFSKNEVFVFAPQIQSLNKLPLLLFFVPVDIFSFAFFFQFSCFLFQRNQKQKEKNTREGTK